MRLNRPITVAALAAMLVLATAACGGGDGRGSGGTITADGSSTVGPFTTKAAEDFKAQGGVDVTVGISGTGGGFERFCRDETDISNASRPIKDEEAAICADAGIDYLELTVATDALTNVVNPENDWVDCLTVDQLKAIWEPGSKVDSWRDVDESYPDVPLRLYGAGTDSGTFDYFTEEINGEEGVSRKDYNNVGEDDNATVNGVKGAPGGMGYFGFSYFTENEGSLKALEIDGGKGCVAPSVETAQNDEYVPLSRPLFIYPSGEALEEEVVKEFVDYYLENVNDIAEAVGYIPLTEEQLEASKDATAKLTE